MRLALLFGITFLTIRWYVFSHSPNSLPQKVTDTQTLLTKKDAFAGRYVRLKGTVANCYYVPGIGYYELVDTNGYAISILCDHYPPVPDQLYEVIIYVHPLIRMEKSIMLQLEVKVPPKEKFFSQIKN